jgi:hypothetical protein
MWRLLSINCENIMPSQWAELIQPPLDLIIFVKKLGDLIKISDFANIQKKMFNGFDWNKTTK